MTTTSKVADMFMWSLASVCLCVCLSVTVTMTGLNAVSVMQAMTTTSKVADRFMKKMYLRWKKLALVDKETYTRAVAAQVSVASRYQPSRQY